jgi:hypothetical protein
MKATLLLCLAILSLIVKAEDFTEFKAPPLSEADQKLLAKDLMDWSITHNARAQKKLLTLNMTLSKTMVVLNMTLLMNTCIWESLWTTSVHPLGSH